jgi:glycosyltransferase involved in cell wall biosynthesis
LASVIAPISVIIPCYRCTDTILRAVESVAAQTVRPAELILVDDASNDGTLESLYRLQARYPKDWIQVVSLPKNVGPGTARNVGWEAAAQPYLAFLDADDSWHTQKIEIQYSWMAKHPEVALTGHGYRIVKNNFINNEDSRISATQPSRAAVWQLLLSNRFQTPTLMLRRDLPQRFKDGKRYSEDYLLLLQIFFSDLPCYRFREKLTYLHKEEFGAGGLTGRLWNLEVGELNTYHEIYKQKLVGLGPFIILSFYSLLKFVRRVILAKVLRRLY